MNLIILITQTFECFVRAMDKYVAEDSIYKYVEMDSMNIFTNMHDFLSLSEILNIVLNQSQFNPEKIIEACAYTTCFNVVTFKNKYTAKIKIVDPVSSVICEFFNNIDKINIRSKDDIKRNFNILKIILGAREINIPDLYNDAITRIASFGNSSAVLEYDYYFEGLDEDAKCLITSLNSEVTREKKDISIKIVNDIITTHIEALGHEILESVLFAYFSSFKVIRALLELEKAIHDYNNRFILNKLYNYFSNDNYECINYKISVLIIETFKHFAQNNRELIMDMKKYITIENAKFLVEAQIIQQFGWAAWLVYNKDNFFNAADNFISIDIKSIRKENLDTHFNRHLRFQTVINNIITNKIYKYIKDNDVQKWNDLLNKYINRWNILN